jgi:glycosyltransferase involved in cell wall biosynthesis
MLTEENWQVVPFAMQHPQNIPSKYDQYFVEEIEYGKQYSFIRQIGNAQKVIYSFEARRKIRALAEQYRPDIAHAHNIYHHLSPAIFSVLKDMGIPTVLTLHDLKIACPAYKMLAPDGLCERCNGGGLKNVVLRSCVKGSVILSSIVYLEAVLHKLLRSYSHSVDKFVVPSKFYQDKFVEWGWPREKLIYIPNFIDTTSIEMAQGKCGRAFVYMGRLAPEKGVATFIEAIVMAGAEGWIVGTGPEEAALKALAIDKKARVRFVGHQDKTALFSLIRQARAVVLPSEWYENAPLSIMEAYALGVPVIGAAIGGIPEMITPDKTGLLFESGNAAALANAMAKMEQMTDADVRAMGRYGNNLMKEGFGPLHYKERMFDLYKSLGVHHG